MVSDSVNPDAMAPNSIGAGFFSWVPAPVQAAMKWIAAIVGWIGVANSSISILERLTWVGSFSQWLLNASGVFREILIGLWERVHDIIEVWRALTAPVRDALLSWVPLDLRGVTLDFVIISSIVFVAVARQELRLARLRRSAISDLRVQQKGMFDAAEAAPEQSYETAMEAGARRVENLISLVRRSRSAGDIRKAVSAAEDSEHMIHKNRWGAVRRSALILARAVQAVNSLFWTSVALATFLAVAVILDLFL